MLTVQRTLTGAVLGAMLLAGCGGGRITPTPLASEHLAATKVAETCPPAADPLASVVPSLVRVTTPADASGAYAAGTGIIIDAGWVLTNQHVIESAPTGLVTTMYADGHSSAGKVVASDADLDLALVSADTGDQQPVTWGEEGRLQPGSLLFAVGFAGGAREPIPASGHFVGTQVDPHTGQAYILSDVQLLHGDSGGPLLNRCGQVVGINTARIPSVDRGQYTGLSIPGFKARDWSIRKRQSATQ